MDRKPFIQKLPDAWRRFDKAQAVDGGSGPLERYLGVWDDGFDRVRGKIRALLALWTVDKCPDRYLPLLAPRVGHVWDSARGYDWNRRRIRNALWRWSRKGSIDSIEDLVREHGGSWFDVVDMASTLWVWNRQGRLNRGDSHTIAENFHHDGAFLLRLLDDIDFEAFVRDFQEVRQRIRPGATVWYFDRIVGLDDVIAEMVSSSVCEVGVLGSSVPHGRFNRDLWLTFQGALKGLVSVAESPRAESDRKHFGRFNTDMFLTFPGALKSLVVSAPSPRVESDKKHFGRFNLDMFLTFPGAPRGKYDVNVSTGGAATGGLISVESVIHVDRTDITVDQGVPGNLMTLEQSLRQEPAALEEGTV